MLHCMDFVHADFTVQPCWTQELHRTASFPEGQSSAYMAETHVQSNCIMQHASAAMDFVQAVSIRQA